MVKFERFVQYIQTTLQRTLAEVEYIPRKGMNPPKVRAALPVRLEYEGSMEVYFSDGCWHLFFEWLSKHEDAPRRFDLDYKTRCLKADLSEIAKTLSRILQDPPASPPKN